MELEHCTGTTCTSVEIGRDHYRTEITAGNHTIIADEPLDIGGEDKGVNPNELFLASLGSCTVITLRMYADRKEWPVDSILVDLKMDIVKGNETQTTYIKKHITILGDISEEQKQRMLKIADSCPLHRIMTNPIVISSNLIPGKE
ncbi:OsmC family protein [Daejeonella lutea]|uniref:Putative redox protein n=1 Tax=Daejeonella lutea TaxID=572036 RepID=A0A1T5ANN0_9SPHI|nr:OsmC family protein [Daejeonella lutea]SKB36624.1 putative redox protein [Daejeonella lutea]